MPGASEDETVLRRIPQGIDGSRTLLVEIDDMISGFCFLDRDSEAMVISSVTRKKLLLWDGDRLSELADLASTGCNLVNDMIRTEGGDCFVGSLCFPEGAKGLFDQVPGPIIRVDPGGNVSIGDDEVLFPNGFVITPDGGTLVVASTGWSNLLAYDLGRDGTLSNRRVFATIPGSAPDGIAGEEARSVLEALPAQLNIFRVMAHADTCFAPQLQLGAAILTRQAPGHADRELLILLVARLEGGDYEWHQHCPIALAVGVDQSRIDAIRRLDLGSSHFAERERALLAFGRQVTEDVRADGARAAADG